VERIINVLARGVGREPRCQDVAISLNVLVRNVHGVGTCTPNTKHQFNLPFLTRDISTTIALIDNALVAIKARKLREDIVY
jgi:hypothetical protein